ncbi:hypothetical protein C8F04DRAFT_1184076 [Mycena alexandri]|uniref:Uncharacterized protein n=1 Tax=Mycena alexandri TaxID=1745969 RepID=A0AAD6SVU2_9AGAR|nr:hypothetical protein C8F04DRAFT_1184076 [Mycena alexandri]
MARIGLTSRSPRTSLIYPTSSWGGGQLLIIAGIPTLRSANATLQQLELEVLTCAASLDGTAASQHKIAASFKSSPRHSDMTAAHHLVPAAFDIIAAAPYAALNLPPLPPKQS